MGYMTTNEQTRPLDIAVTAVIRAEAAAQKLTWPALAELSGVAKSTMSNYLNDGSPLKVATLDAIAEALGLDILEVIRRARERMEQPPLTVVTEAGVPTGEAARPSGSGPRRPRSHQR